MRTILCQLDMHDQPVSLQARSADVVMGCEHCKRVWTETWSDWMGLYLQAPRGPLWPA